LAVLLPKIVNIKEQLDEISSVSEIKLKNEEDRVVLVKNTVLQPIDKRVGPNKVV
jgi:hypothetical protein